MIRTSEKIENLAEALAKFQSECPVVSFDSTNPFLKNKYASLSAIIQATKPALSAAGLSVLQFVTQEGLCTRIMHKSGEWIESTAPMLEITEEKGKSTAQVYGSIISYLRRYTYSAALGIVADEDTDGNGVNGVVQTKKNTGAKQMVDIDKAEELDMIKSQLNLQKSIKDLTKYWNDNPFWHNDRDVKKLFSDRRKQLET